MTGREKLYEQFRAKYQKVEIPDAKANTPESPLVSVCVQTYRHAEFIRECLDSLLNQKVDFEYEILLGEDASTDGTREICIEYAEKYPERIRLFLHRRENNIAVGGKPTGRFNFLHNLLNAKGQFIAICEGDDYWTDTNKLQRQVDFLRTHSEASMVYTNAQKLLDGKMVSFLEQAAPPTLMDSNQFILGQHRVPTCSVLIRTEVVTGIIQSLFTMKNDIFHMDYFMWTMASKFGKIGFIENEMVVYRVHSGSMVRQAENKITLLIGMELNQFLADQFQGNVRDFFLKNNWWYYLEFSFLEILAGSWLSAFYWLLRSLTESIRRDKKNQMQILRDFVYRARHRPPAQKA